MNIRHLLIDTFTYMPPANILADLSEEEANLRLGKAPHSIAEIVAHMRFWQDWFLKRCKGEAEPMVTSASLGWPQVNPSDWIELRQSFLAGLEDAASYTDKDDVLRQRLEPAIEFPPLAEYCVLDALVHMATHNAHHFGQIVTLRQAMGMWPPPTGSWTW